MYKSKLAVYNTLTRKKELFQPYHFPYVGMYLCGPTVYGHAHLGHARNAVSFDVIFRYLKHIGYQVTYVRNVTDVGHLEQDMDDGKDKVEQQAQLEKKKPMEVAQQYTNSYHHDMALLNMQSPSIEPRASGHITEQIAMIEKIIVAGLAYVSDGSVYFDVAAYNKKNHYGKLSGRIVKDLLAGTRALSGQEGKQSPLDFALWKKVTPMHIMRWPSPWGEGFPGWHIECAAIATKYLGVQFEIHGGGMDLLFPHHECELAQAQATVKAPFAKYWLHNNMVTIEGTKMGKSLGNFITLQQLFSGEHVSLDQPYTPMTLRFFMLQAHYRGQLVFSTAALKAAQKAYRKLMNGLYIFSYIDTQYVRTSHSTQLDREVIKEIHSDCDHCYQAMDDDFNTAKVLAILFNLLKKINAIKNGKLRYDALDKDTYKRLKETYTTFITVILGLKEEMTITTKGLVDTLLPIYQQAKINKDYKQVDFMRRSCKKIGILLQDSVVGVTWEYMSN